jgi:hypothetical protein
MKPEELTSKQLPSLLPRFEKYYPICFREDLEGQTCKKEEQICSKVSLGQCWGRDYERL